MKNVFMMVPAQLLAHSPALIVCIAGAVFSLVLWRRCPKSSLLILMACLVLTLLIVAQTLVNPLVLLANAKMGWSASEMGIVYTVIGIGSSMVHAVALALLVGAGFIGRTKAEA